jgi:ABC-type amino acid transport system permease subunit
VPDVMQTTNVINAREQDPILLYSTLAVVFFLICYGISHAIQGLERRTRQRMALGA